MTDMNHGVNRGQFLRNAGKGGIVLATAGGVLAAAEGVAFASGPTKSDIPAASPANAAQQHQAMRTPSLLTLQAASRHAAQTV